MRKKKQLDRELAEVDKAITDRANAIGAFREMRRLIVAQSRKLVFAGTAPNTGRVTLVYRHAVCTELAVVLEYKLLVTTDQPVVVSVELQFPDIVLAFCHDGNAGTYADLKTSIAAARGRMSREMLSFIRSLRIETVGYPVRIHRASVGLKRVWRFNTTRLMLLGLEDALKRFVALTEVIEG